MTNKNNKVSVAAIENALKNNISGSIALKYSSVIQYRGIVYFKIGEKSAEINHGKLYCHDRGKRIRLSRVWIEDNRICLVSHRNIEIHNLYISSFCHSSLELHLKALEFIGAIDIEEDGNVRHITTQK